MANMATRSNQGQVTSCRSLQRIARIQDWRRGALCVALCDRHSDGGAEIECRVFGCTLAGGASDMVEDTWDIAADDGAGTITTVSWPGSEEDGKGLAGESDAGTEDGSVVHA